MRILILTPRVLPSVTGNAITVERWRRSLMEKGLDVRVLAAEGLDCAALMNELSRFRPDLIHVHHAFQAGRLLLDPRIAGEFRHLPLVVSPAGTDINGDLEKRERKEVVLRVFRLARVIIAQGRGTVQRLEKVLAGLQPVIIQVPKAVCWLGQEAFDLRGIAGWGPEDFIFFVPAGIRPVKGNLECLAALEGVYARRPRVRAVFAGPALDSEYAARFEKEIDRLRPFARWIHLVPPGSMRSAYEGADVVLNASLSEGLSNALLEAMFAGRPVLASDIQGNRWAVLGENGDQPYGCLFDPHDPEDFIRQALKLIDDAEFKDALVQAARRRAAKWPSPREEAEGLTRAYQAAAKPS